MRDYKPKCPKKYTKEQLNEAVGKIKDGTISLRQASLQYTIPKGTLSNHINDVTTKKKGCQQDLTVNEENIIVENLNLTKGGNSYYFPLPVEVDH